MSGPRSHHTHISYHFISALRGELGRLGELICLHYDPALSHPTAVLFAAAELDRSFARWMWRVLQLYLMVVAFHQGICHEVSKMMWTLGARYCHCASAGGWARGWTSCGHPIESEYIFKACHVNVSSPVGMIGRTVPLQRSSLGAKCNRRVGECASAWLRVLCGLPVVLATRQCFAHKNIAYQL